MKTTVLLATALSTISSATLAQPIFDYVKAADDAYTWAKTDESTIGPGATLTQLKLTSQVWRSTTWTHRLQIITPAQMRYPQTALMLITGGSPNRQELAHLSVVAGLTSAPVVVLGDIPNQPLYDGLREDALIAFTFNEYLASGESDWPLLFPMTKAVVRAMDAVAQYTEQAWDEPVASFYVTGASKRGWTTWFTAVVAPERIVGIAPMVYDNLNLPAQMPHQLAAWGNYSEQISEYTELNLPQLVTADGGRELAAIVDPYTYRARATMPKLIITGTNDRYWPLDAANLYFADLPDPKCLLYVPNCGHGLEDMMRVINAQIGFFAACTGRAPLPELDWSLVAERHLKLFVSSDVVPKRVWQWTASSPTRDFREAVWQRGSTREHGGDHIARLSYPDEGYAALFAEAVYGFPGAEFSVCTTVQIVAAR